jgi:hypothetical protein
MAGKGGRVVGLTVAGEGTTRTQSSPHMTVQVPKAKDRWSETQRLVREIAPAWERQRSAMVRKNAVDTVLRTLSEIAERELVKRVMRGYEVANRLLAEAKVATNKEDAARLMARSRYEALWADRTAKETRRA